MSPERAHPFLGSGGRCSLKEPNRFSNQTIPRTFSILFVNPSLGITPYCREDRLRTYLSLGTLSSALRDKDFIRKFVLQSVSRHPGDRSG